MGLKEQLERRQEEARMKRSDRLPPGQSLTRVFPVLHLGSVPDYDMDKWDLRVYGEVEQERSWSWSEFNRLPRTTITMDIHCVTRWSKFDTLWEGVSLATLVREGIVIPRNSARFVIQHCENGYTTNLPMKTMLLDNVLLATHFDGKPLEPEHGYPLRVVVGSFSDRSEESSPYFWKGGKWLRALEFSAEDQPGLWERNGYHNDADPWTEERFSYR